jgi:hypothetical protein
VPVLFEGLWSSKEVNKSERGYVEALKIPLDFSISAADGAMDQLLIVRLIVPEDCPFWALNISSMMNSDLENLFFHCTRNNKSILLDEKMLTWRNAKDKDSFKRLPQIPQLANNNLLHIDGIDLVFRVRNEGIYLFLRNDLLVSLPMRRDIASKSPLLLSFPTLDDNGNFYGTTIKKVQWAETKDYDTVFVIPSDRIDQYEGILSAHIDDDPIRRTIEVSNLFEASHGDAIWEMESHLTDVIEGVFDGASPVDKWNFLRGVGVAYLRLLPTADPEDIDKVIEVLSSQYITSEEGVSKKINAKRAAAF